MSQPMKRAQPLPQIKPSIVRQQRRESEMAWKRKARNEKRKAKGLPSLRAKFVGQRHHPDCAKVQSKIMKCDCQLAANIPFPRKTSRLTKIRGLVNVDHLPKNKRVEVAAKLHEAWERRRARAGRMDARTAEGHARLIALAYTDIMGDAKALALAQPEYCRDSLWLQQKSEVRIVLIPATADTRSWFKAGQDVAIYVQLGAVSAPTYEACMIELRTWLANERERRAKLHENQLRWTERAWRLTMKGASNFGVASIQTPPSKEHAFYINTNTGPDTATSNL